MDSLILTPKQLASALKNRRKELCLTQIEAASRIGLLPKTISALESSPERCSLESLLKLVSVLDLEITLKSKPDTPKDSLKGEW